MKQCAYDRLPPMLMSGTARALRTRSGLAFDRATVRKYDRDGRLHVAVSNISKAAVNPYVGHEIPDWEGLGLDPDRVYNLLRDPEELAKAAPTFNNLPLLSKHVPVTADDHQPNVVVGSTGTDSEFVHPFLRNSLVLWAKDGIDGVESDEQRELSSAYHYRAEMTPGSYEGEAYDGVMRDIVGNHVALVENGRAGTDVVVGDSMEILLMAAKSKKFLSTTAAISLGAVATFLAPKLAMDAKLDITPAFADLTSKNFKEKKPGIVAALTKLVDGKLAQDASIEGLMELLDRVEAVKGDDAGSMEPNAGLPIAAVSPEDDDQTMDADPMEAAKAFAKSKMTAQDAAEYDRLCAGPNGAAKDAEMSEEDKKKAEAEKAAKDEADKDVVKKPAMDAAIAAAVELTKRQQKALREAERAVRPYVGDLALACDSADEVYKTALTHLGVKGVADIHPSAYPALLSTQAKPGDRKPQGRDLAMDAAGGADFDKRFPGASRIQVAG